MGGSAVAEGSALDRAALAVDLDLVRYVLTHMKFNSNGEEGVIKVYDSIKACIGSCKDYEQSQAVEVITLLMEVGTNESSNDTITLACKRLLPQVVECLLSYPYDPLDGELLLKEILVERFVSRPSLPGGMIALLFQHGIVTEEQITAHCDPDLLEKVTMLVQSNRKKSAQTSVL